MNLHPGMYVVDNDEVVYKVLHIKHQGDYSEAVLEIMGDTTSDTMMFAVFYRSNWAFCDRENPDFRLVAEVDYYPSIVK